MTTATNEALVRLDWERDEADRRILWERYKLLSSEVIDYLKIVIQFTVFFYGITGAIMSFVLSRPDAAYLKVAFLLPAIMGIGSAGAYLFFAFNQKLGNEELERLASKLFGFTSRELRAIEYLNGQTPYISMSPEAQLEEYRQKYGIDGGYIFRTTHPLQVTLGVLGFTNLVIGLFSLALYFYH